MELKVQVNGEDISNISSSSINIMDFDEVQFFLEADNNVDLDIYVEDYILPIQQQSESSLNYYSIKDKIFRESFGYSTVRVYIANELKYELLFNILTKEDKFEQIKEMVVYLLKENNRVLDICLARTKLELDNFNELSPNLESVINLSEDIIQIFLSKKGNFSKILKKRLENSKEAMSGSNHFNNIDPYEIFNNISDIFPSNDPESITIKGKKYSLENINRDILKDSYNLEENQILVGGLHSIKNTLLDIKTTIPSQYVKEVKLTYDQEYSNLKNFQKNFTIEDLYLNITTDGLLKRIDSILISIDTILFELQKRLDINFLGYKYPKNTPFVKNSSFYKSIFNKLFEWYNLGEPNLGINKNLIKIRSISKIYELFCLYSVDVR